MSSYIFYDYKECKTCHLDKVIRHDLEDCAYCWEAMTRGNQMNRKRFIVAGNIKEFKKWELENPESIATFVAGPNEFRGQHHFDVEYYGTYYRRNDLLDIEEQIWFARLEETK